MKWFISEISECVSYCGVIFDLSYLCVYYCGVVAYLLDSCQRFLCVYILLWCSGLSFGFLSEISVCIYTVA